MFTECVSPPKLAKWLGVNRDKVLGWIHSGKLRAKNVANPTAKRPRFVIPPDAIEEFMNPQSATKRPPRSVGKGRERFCNPHNPYGREER